MARPDYCDATGCEIHEKGASGFCRESEPEDRVNAINSQVSVLYDFCQYELARRGQGTVFTVSCFTTVSTTGRGGTLLRP